MHKRIAVFTAAFLLVLPLTNVLADDTTGTSTTAATTNCGTTPTAPASGASATDLQQYRQQLRTYYQCERGNMQGQRTALQADQKQNSQQRCQNIATRIGDRITKFNTDKSTIGDKYGDMVARLQQLSTNLSSKGVNVSTLNTNIATLRTDINKVLSDQSALVSAMQTLQGEAPSMCGQSQGQFMTDLTANRQNVLTLQQDRLAVRTFFVGTIQPELMSIRQSLPAATTTATTTTATAATPSSN